MASNTQQVAKIGKPKGSQLKRLTQRPFLEGEVLTQADEPHVRAVPINQWGAIRNRILITGGNATLNWLFGRVTKGAAGTDNPDIVAYGAAVDQPAIDGTLITGGVEVGLEVTDAEHQGEEFAVVTLDSLTADVTVSFFDITGATP